MCRPIFIMFITISNDNIVIIIYMIGSIVMIVGCSRLLYISSVAT